VRRSFGTMGGVAMATRKATRQGANAHRFPDIFEPDIILPAQFTIPRGMPGRGERALLLAVLEMAVRDLELFANKETILDSPQELVRLNFGIRTYYWRDRHERESLMAWFRSNSTAHPFTFVSICEVFGLDPGAFRKQLQKRGWVPVRAPTHLHATGQTPRQLHGGYRGAG